MTASDRDTPSDLRSIARRWQLGPNARLIQRLHGRFLQMPASLQELFLLGLDLEEGVLPLVHVFGFTTRRSITNDDRLITGGVHFDYRDLIAAAAPAAPPADTSAPGAPTQAPETARASRPTDQAPLTIADVVRLDRPEMAAYFPQFRLCQHQDRLLWRGFLRPLAFAPEIFDLVAEYQWHPQAPLRMRVVTPDLHPRSPHRYADGSLCTFYPPLGSWVRGRADDEGEVDDLAALLRFTVTWLVRYKCWLEFGGWWPGVDVPHDPAWLLANIGPGDFCPFHMPARWGACCREIYLRRAS